MFRKDLTLELRSGEVAVTSAFFALLVTVLASMSFHGGPLAGRGVAAGALWLSVAFATVLALGRAWHREREEQALVGLLAAPLSRTALFVGKALGIASFVLAVQAVAMPVTLLLFSLEPSRVLPGLVVLGVLATPGVAAAGALFGVMTVRTRARDLLLAVVLFPLLAPPLLALVVASRELFQGVPLAELGGWLRLLVGFDVLFLVLGAALFQLVLDD